MLPVHVDWLTDVKISSYGYSYEQFRTIYLELLGSAYRSLTSLLGQLTANHPPVSVMYKGIMLGHSQRMGIMLIFPLTSWACDSVARKAS